MRALEALLVVLELLLRHHKPGGNMNELARIIVVLTDELEAGGLLEPSDELRALRETLRTRSRSAADYHTTRRGAAALERAPARPEIP